ncbi:AB-hydrolase YheT [Sistotremastrum niveocremeum HHB9708]|uniref:AB-hydrolase YheT n=1 Tax=Sistotremastrum niveocremeum HHB9708 TaxID=1314777 RepID=A0A164Y864_9AGAM|nr:AB-hydrolase YheT [Sistotremastrum niveocremeum HHB9708]
MSAYTVLLAAVTVYATYRAINWAFFFTSSIKIIVSDWPVNLPSKDEKKSKYVLLEYVASKVPSLFGPNAHFDPIPWLRGGHMQTMYCSIGDFTKVDKIEYQRQLLRLSDGGIAALDFYPSLIDQPPVPGEKVVVVMHGLTGGSHESYVRAALTDLTKPKSEGGLGMRGVVMNFRGCADSPIVTRRLYHAGDTGDLKATMLYLTHKVFKDAQYFGVGFSLGGNAITKYCGEEGDDCPFSAAVSVANVWDFLRGNYHIEGGTLLNHYVYDGVLGGALQSLLGLHKHAFPENAPGLPYIPTESLLKAKGVTLRYFDDRVTAPVFGFKSALDYYTQISSTRWVERVKIPLLGLNARNDPIVSEANHPDVQIRSNPYVILATTGGGGHMGWFERGWTRWYVRPVHQFLDAMIQADIATRPIPKATAPDSKGMVFQEGKPEVGYLEIGPNDFTVVSGDGKSKLFSGW